MREVIYALKSLDLDFNLKLNLNKSQIISAEELLKIADIKITKRASYLGVILDTDITETKRAAWNQAKKSLPYLCKGLRRVDQTIREHL